MTKRKTLQSYGTIRGVDTESHRVTCVVSTGNVARDGAVINPDGWDTRNYDRNPVVLWSHRDGEMPVARTVEYASTPDGLVATAEFDMEDEEAARLFGKISRGYVNGTSVRWKPIKTSVRRVDGREVLVFEKAELLEWSFVSVPSDPEALIIRSDDGEELDTAAFISATDLANPENPTSGEETTDNESTDETQVEEAVVTADATEQRIEEDTPDIEAANKALHIVAAFIAANVIANDS